MVDAEGTYTYTYDNSNELTAVHENGTEVNSYSYDANGNQDGTGFSTTVMNEQSASPGYTYTYDKAGNLISETNTSTYVTTTYTYDYRNRLTEVEVGGTIVATYTYNALNQRIGIDDNGTQTWTVYDGSSADANPYADFNGSGTLEERYLFGPGVVNGAVVDEILARTSSGGTTAWYLTDKLGSVRDIVTLSGGELDHIVYDSFGNIVTESESANGDRFKFAGMEYDSVTDQYYDRARYYDEALGRFMGQDPAGFGAGDTDLYRYVGNDPTNDADPSGLLAVTLFVKEGKKGRRSFPVTATGTVGAIDPDCAFGTVVITFYPANPKIPPLEREAPVKANPRGGYVYILTENLPFGFWTNQQGKNVAVTVQAVATEFQYPGHGLQGPPAPKTARATRLLQPPAGLPGGGGAGAGGGGSGAGGGGSGAGGGGSGAGGGGSGAGGGGSGAGGGGDSGGSGDSGGAGGGGGFDGLGPGEFEPGGGEGGGQGPGS